MLLCANSASMTEPVPFQVFVKFLTLPLWPLSFKIEYSENSQKGQTGNNFKLFVSEHLLNINEYLDAP